LDSSLVSNENLSEMLLSNSWAPGQVRWGKILCHSQKTWNPKPKNLFFIANSKTWIFWGFEQLSSAIG